jgi:hypothetical protein
MAQQFLSDKKYIMAKARSLPIKACYIGKDYQEKGITNALIIRQEPGGKFTMGFFLVDLFCLGIKDAHSLCHYSQDEVKEMLKRAFEESEMEQMEVDPVFFHNLVYGSIDYAEELGIKPHKDFALAEYILDPNMVDDGIDDIEFGSEGRPLYVPGTLENPAKVLHALRKHAGAENVDIMMPDGEVMSLEEADEEVREQKREELNTLLDRFVKNNRLAELDYDDDDEFDEKEEDNDDDDEKFDSYEEVK